MSSFKRRENLENAVKDRYGIDITVQHRTISQDEYQIKLLSNGKEALLQEKMEGGLTKHVLLTIEGHTTKYDQFHKAELKAIEFLR